MTDDARRFLVEGRFGYEDGESIRKIVLAESESQALDRYLAWVYKYHENLYSEIYNRLYITELADGQTNQT